MPAHHSCWYPARLSAACFLSHPQPELLLSFPGLLQLAPLLQFPELLQLTPLPQFPALPQLSPPLQFPGLPQLAPLLQFPAPLRLPPRLHPVPLQSQTLPSVSRSPAHLLLHFRICSVLLCCQIRPAHRPSLQMPRSLFRIRSCPPPEHML